MDDHKSAPEDFESKGVLSPVASKIVLNVLYLACTRRLELLWTVNDLARNVTKCNPSCDKRLQWLISYIECTKDWVYTCIVGDRSEQCKIAMFVDASFAGELQDGKPTSDVFLFLVDWLCKKQGAISLSSSESEVIALDTGLRLEGIPALNLWDQVVEIYYPKKPT